jgi:hypothetical protein
LTPAGRRGRIRSAGAAVLAALALAGCGNGEETGGAPPNSSPSSGSSRPGPAESLPPEARPKPPEPTGASLTAVEPEELGNAVPAKYLPSGFPLPKEAKAAEGFSDPKPNTGQFYLRIDAPMVEVSAFFEREYRAEGWKQIKDETSEEDGKQGFDLLFTRKNSQQSAGFTAEEQDGKALVQVYYNDSSKL